MLTKTEEYIGDKEFFLDWFNSEFVPSIRRHPSSINFPMYAVLLLDTRNYPCHSEKFVQNFTVKMSTFLRYSYHQIQLLKFNQ